jgi:D-alanyl-D-alanine carboxypeptidase
MKISLVYHVFIVFIVFFGLHFSAISDASANPRYASIILEESSGKILFSRNADKQLRPASLTKIMTLYLIFEALQQKKVTMDTRMKVSRVAASRSPSKLYLKPGHTITVKNAILALVTKSANDVATVVAEHLGGGSEREFARKMTRKAKSLGMSRTIFRNASGLPHSSQYSTARDMARLGMESDVIFRSIFIISAAPSLTGTDVNLKIITGF